jgi:hypothetical protein
LWIRRDFLSRMQDTFGQHSELANGEICKQRYVPMQIFQIWLCSIPSTHWEVVSRRKSCEFRPYSCPYRGVYCPWKCPLEYKMPHLKMSHKSIETIQREDVFTPRGINRSGARSWIKMQSCFGHNFRLLPPKRVTFEGFQHFYVTVQVIVTWNCYSIVQRRKGDQVVFDISHVDQCINCFRDIAGSTMSKVFSSFSASNISVS